MTDYANGFKDGFAAGLEEGKKLNDKTYTDGLIEGMKKTLPPPYVPKETCPKCGIIISGVMGYVCSSINCPTFYQASYGAVGTNDTAAYAKGANGSAAPDNSVWINGKWASLGN
jgi:hypothetical protein